MWGISPDPAAAHAPRQRMVPRKGLEPSRPLSHWHLKPARLPIPPPGPVPVGSGGGLIGRRPLPVNGMMTVPRRIAARRRIVYRLNLFPNDFTARHAEPCDHLRRLGL